MAAVDSSLRALQGLPLYDSKIVYIPMISLTNIVPDNAMVFKAVRLRALQESPSAFGSTYAREVQLTDEEWIIRTHKWSGDRGIGFLAMDDGSACGMVCSFLDDHDPASADLISMWTAATHRQQGVGRLLVNAVEDWARSRGVSTVLLMVTSNNAPAIAFYERLGFSKTGETKPYPNDPDLFEYQMSKAI
jgi:ribosomal protein S18 acetylase RimI-like enzyme